MYAYPMALAVTTPLELTEATAGLEDVQLKREAEVEVAPLPYVMRAVKVVEL